MTKSKRRTGRTTRMLQHAIQRSRNGLETAVFGLDSAHVDTLSIQLEDLLGPDDALEGRIKILSFSYVPTSELLAARNFSYSAGRFAGTEVDAILLDHAVMEYKLSRVIQYLTVTSQIEDVAQWLAVTALALNAQGRMVKVITDLAGETEISNITKAHTSMIKFESGFSPDLGLDWFDLSVKNAHPAQQFLFDPRHLQKLFAGALATVTRWDE